MLHQFVSWPAYAVDWHLLLNTLLNDLALPGFCRKTGNAGLMAEGKERFADYKADKADGNVNWAQQGKDAVKDWKPHVSPFNLSCTCFEEQLPVKVAKIFLCTCRVLRLQEALHQHHLSRYCVSNKKLLCSLYMLGEVSRRHAMNAMCNLQLYV